MKCLMAVIVFIFTNCFASSEALQCYDCLYFDGHPDSDPSCQETPSSTLVKTCPVDSKIYTTSIYTLTDSSSASGHFNRTSQTLISSFVETDPDDHKLAMCVKFTGVLDDKPAVARGCIRAPGMFNGTCTYEYYHFFIDGRTVSDALTCMCDGENCNGASGVRISNVWLFAYYAVHVLYKTYTK